MEFKEDRDEINRMFFCYTKRGCIDYRNCRGLWSDMSRSPVTGNRKSL